MAACLAIQTRRKAALSTLFPPIPVPALSSSASLSVSGRPKPQHSSCGTLATQDELPVDVATVVDDDVFNSPPSAASRRRRLAAAVAAARAGASPSAAVGDAWMRPRLGSSVVGRTSTSPPQISLRDIRKVRLKKKIGTGGFGSVYLGVYRDRTVAVKRLHRCVKNARAKLESFRAECNVVNLKHPNIVRVLAASAGGLPQQLMTEGAGVAGAAAAAALRCGMTAAAPAAAVTRKRHRDDAVIVMEYVGERNLLSIINDRRQALPNSRRVRYALDIARAVRFLHDARIVHLDLKPSNVIVTIADVCKLGDFGCCQVLEGDTGRVSPTQRSSFLTGTFAYRAPELLRGESPDPKADIYAFGITLWQMEARQTPYFGHEPHAIIFNVVAYNARPSMPSLAADDAETDDGYSSCSSSSCDDDMQYRELYCRCWQAERNIRPTAGQLVDLLTHWASSSADTCHARL